MKLLASGANGPAHFLQGTTSAVRRAWCLALSAGLILRRNFGGKSSGQKYRQRRKNSIKNVDN
jgi:hypothetical protein